MNDLEFLVSDWEYYQEAICDTMQKIEDLKITEEILNRWEKMKKITFIRNMSAESSRISKLLTDSNIDFREVFSEDEPCLIVPDMAYSIKGFNNIKAYVSRTNK
jgi:hypothetical protein